MNSVKTQSTKEMEICCLCAMEHANGVELFSNGSEHWAKIVDTIYGYVRESVKCCDANLLPNWLCVACQLEAESTAKFLQLMEEGQEKLRQLLSNKIEVNKTEAITNKNELQTSSDEPLTVSSENDEERMLNIKATKHITKKPTTKTFINTRQSKRLRRAPKRFINETVECAPLTDQLTTKVGEQDASTLASKEPIAELHDQAGKLLAEIIQIDDAQHSKMRLICEYCKEVFALEKQFLKHVGTHQHCSYECRECLENFSSKVLIEEHQKAMQHSGMGIVENINGTTENCNEKQPSSAKNFACLKCKKQFQNHYAVRRHYKQVHVDERIYKCNKCVASFKNKSNYNYHMANHAGARPFQCSYCEKRFILNTELTLHKRVHTGVKPYKCFQCSKVFAHRSNLVVHRRTHNNERPFKCATCGALFTSSSHLKKHCGMHLRQAQKPLNCDMVAKRTQDFPAANMKTNSLLKPAALRTSLNKLNERVNIEKVENLPPLNEMAKALETVDQKLSPQRTNAQPSIIYKFQCQHCLKYFRERSMLVKHQRTHTGEKPYKCPLCPKAFADASNFKRHKTLHRNATDELNSVSTQLNTADLLQQLRQASCSPAHSNAASDPDPDGLEMLQRVETDDRTSPSVTNDGYQLVYISYQDPTKQDSKTTTYFVIN